MADFDVEQEGVTGPGRRPVTDETTFRELWENLKHDLKNIDSKPLPEPLRQAEPVLRYLDERLGMGFWSIAGLVVAGLVFGKPHMLTTHQCSGSCQSSSSWQSSCNYVGITGSTVVNPPDGKCPGFKLL